MTIPRRAVLAIVVVVTLVAGAACTTPPSSDGLGQTVGGVIGLLFTILAANLACGLNESCEHPICAMFPCTPTATTPAAVASDPLPSG